ncbi:5'-methylthioadenosine phosphorylase [Stackebrandtia albiflava]|uniref:Purine nucleoside phosphorylase n=1 Tax=Stackebrandtia albiflava TaxID=406432 RepID=A0A562URT6_9ACTN|nr:S-methyl-5'-thioadenosine phosphorylase [Stackebrandtia albiflava]TWJ08333.1 5'-methylthioadenosine phosphorylase [Stackebrandtia albiflava]
MAAPGPVSPPGAAIAVVGGSGLYSLFESPVRRTVETPYGAPSDDVAVGELAGRPVAFLPRHGPGHRFPPHRINYRANLWSLAEAGARRVIGVSAVGGLSPDLAPGGLVVPDQLVDRTSGRPQTFFDGPETAHAPFADPYCGPGRAAVLAAARSCGRPATDGGTQVVVEGPRFSTRAESRWYAAQGWSLIGMTALPEVSLARELGLCYLPLCLVTDMDAGVEQGSGVTQDEVMELFAANLAVVGDILATLVADLPDDLGCDCADLAPKPL